jgi:hypothetical protein
LPTAPFEELKEFVAQAGRDASDTIRGYFYQIHVTLERWLALGTDEILELERGEDVDLVSQVTLGRTVEQVKALSGSITLRSPGARAAVAHFVAHRALNPELRIQFLFTTTAVPARERPSPLADGVTGIDAWTTTRSGVLAGSVISEYIGGIRVLLTHDECPDSVDALDWQRFQIWLSASTDTDLIDLIAKFEWATGAPKISGRRETIIATLTAAPLSLESGVAQIMFDRLVVAVLTRLTMPGLKRLAHADLNELFVSTPTALELGQIARVHSILADFESRLGKVESRVGQVEQSVEQLSAIASHVHASQINLDPWHHRRRAPTKELDVLQTDVRAMALVGRSDELQSLDEWLVSERMMTVRCLIGRGGTGKTRLAIELCERAESQGWRAGRMSHETLVRIGTDYEGDAWKGSEQPTLVVIDDAASAVGPLRVWLGKLATLTITYRLRVLLLERSADESGGWWFDLIRPGTLASASIDSLLDPEAPVRLRPLGTVADRRALLLAAMQSAARLNGTSTLPTLPAPGLRPDFDKRLATGPNTGDPLFLIMAGVVAASGDAPTALALSRPDLAKRVADSERERFGRLASAAHIEPTLLAYLTACVTLQGGCSRADSTALVEQESQEAGYSLPLPAEAIASLLADALAAEQGGDLEPIRPDLIGEAFVLTEIGAPRRPLEKQHETIRRAFNRSPIAVAVFVIHTVQEFADDAKAADAIAWLDDVLAPTADLSVMTSIADVLPQRSVVLQARATKFQEELVERLAAEVDTRALALARNTLVTRYLELNKPDQALQASQKSVLAYRALADRQPEIYDREVAWALNNLAIALDRTGREANACEVARDAAARYRRVVAARPNETVHRGKFALTLLNSANRCKDLKPREASHAAMEAVRILTRLCLDEPHRYRPSYALALMTLANILQHRGRLGIASRLAPLAIQIQRDLSAALPDEHRFMLAQMIHNGGVISAKMGRLAEARNQFQEAEQLFRRVVSESPTDRIRLLRTLQGLAKVLVELGAQDEAAGKSREAESLRIELGMA